MACWDINNKLPDIKHFVKIRIYNLLVKNINDKNPPDKCFDNLDLPVYFIPFYINFFLRKYY